MEYLKELVFLLFKKTDEMESVDMRLIAGWSGGCTPSNRFSFAFGGRVIGDSLALGHCRFERGFLRKVEGGEILSVET